MNCSVYVIKAGKKRYVGVSSEVSERVNTHLRGDYLVGRAMRKYGWIVEVVFTGSRIECYGRERDLVMSLNTLHPRGLNLTPGGLGCPDPTDDVKQSISTTLKKYYSDPAIKAEMVNRLTRARQSETAKKNLSTAMKRSYAKGWTENRRTAGVDGL